MAARATALSFVPADPPRRLDTYVPMLLGQRAQPFNDPGWTYELGFDGYRTLAEFGSGMGALQSRNGADASDWFAEVTVALATLPGGPHIIDGEVCVLDRFGRSDIERLEARAKERRWRPDSDPVVYCVFDLLMHNGDDITALALRDRKRLLAKVFHTLPPAVLLVDSIAEQGERLYEQAMALQFERIVAKRLDSPYRPGVRSNDWLAIQRSRTI